MMVRVLCVLPLVAACFSYAAGTCEPKVMKKIQEMRKGINDCDKVLKMQGIYYVVYASGSSAVPKGFSNSTCQGSTFDTDPQGKHRAIHKGPLEGCYTLECDKENDKLLVRDRDTDELLRYSYIVYTSPDYKVLTLYSCNVTCGTNVSVGSTLVYSPVINDSATARLVQKGKDALTTCDLKKGESLTACYKNPKSC